LAGVGNFSSIASGSTGDLFLYNKALLLNKKQPRERIISAKLPKEHDKLPPPPLGKTMGHGLLNK
jgi:hypothetical protein